MADGASNLLKNSRALSLRLYLPVITKIMMMIIIMYLKHLRKTERTLLETTLKVYSNFVFVTVINMTFP